MLQILSLFLQYKGLTSGKNAQASPWHTLFSKRETGNIYAKRTRWCCLLVFSSWAGDAPTEQGVTVAFEG